MEWLALSIPAILGLLALLLFKHKFVWWEVLIPIVMGLILIMIMKFSMVSNLVADTEYLSSHVTKTTYYEPWNEYIKRTCSYTTCSGSGKSRHCRTHYYDCSYVKYHPEYWTITTNVGQEIGITRARYQAIVKFFGNLHFLDKHRKYHSIDGDAYVSDFPYIFEKTIPVEYSQEYDNKPQTAETVFHFEKLDSISLKRVYEYPEIVGTNQSSCIGCGKETALQMRRINGLLGRKHQIKVFLCLYKNQTVEVAELQRRHWKNGNKNELVICADVDKKWAKSFSWSDDKSIEVFANYLFQDKTTSNKQKLDKLYEEIPKKWKRKEFKDFDYIDVMLTRNQLMWIYIVVGLVSLIILVWGFFNDFEQEQ